MYCPRCNIPMKLVSNRTYHKNKKFKCPNCGIVRMQKPKSKKKNKPEY